MCICLCVFVRMKNCCRGASKEPVITLQTVSSISDREANSTHCDHSSDISAQNKGKGLILTYPSLHTTINMEIHCALLYILCLQTLCEHCGFLLQALKRKSKRGYIILYLPLIINSSHPDISICFANSQLHQPCWHQMCHLFGFRYLSMTVCSHC